MTSQYNDQQYLDYVKDNCVAQGDVDTGDCEIDGDSVVSTNDDAHGSDGAYVQVWMWVDDASVQHWIQESARERDAKIELDSIMFHSENEFLADDEEHDLDRWP